MAMKFGLVWPYNVTRQVPHFSQLAEEAVGMVVFWETPFGVKIP